METFPASVRKTINLCSVDHDLLFCDDINGHTETGA
jgi:hypothetical protein